MGKRVVAGSEDESAKSDSGSEASAASGSSDVSSVHTSQMSVSSVHTSDLSDDSDSTAPKKKAAKKGSRKAAAKKSKAKKDDSSDSDSDDEPVKKKNKKPAKKKAAPKKSKKKEEEEEEEVWNWWDMDESDIIHGDGIKWKTLKHQGPKFAPAYEPHGIPIKYSGAVFSLTPEEEEIAMFYATMRQSPYYKKSVFRQNFFDCWKKVLYKRPEARIIKDLALVNFDAMWQHYVDYKAREKGLSRDAKQANAKKKKEELAKYKSVMWDGRREEVQNPSMEIPSLFRGRGDHPKMGMVKRRIEPEDVTINCQDVNDPPKPPEGHSWGSVISDNTVTWLAKWNDPIQPDETKYMMADKTSAIKQMADRAKFEKARSLVHKIDDIRADYERKLDSSDMKEVQMGVAMYFIDKLALRVGGEKKEDEADTVGCCSLRAQHVKPMTRVENGKTQHYLHFDFLGKDSIRYVNDVDVPEKLAKLVGKLAKGKTDTAEKKNELFDRLVPSDLNRHFKTIMDGLTAKVFRTYNASYLLDQKFHSQPVDSKSSEAHKLVYFNQLNTDVAILCNHQKTKSKGHDQAAEGMSLKVKETKEAYDRLKEAHDRLKKLKGAKRDAAFQKEKEKYNKWDDEQQWAWLELYGTDEQKEKFNGSKKPASKKKPAGKKKQVDSDSSDDEKVVKKKKKPAPKKKRNMKLDSDSDSDSNTDSDSSEDKKPVKKGRKPVGKKAKSKRKSSESDSDSDSDKESSEDEKPVKKAAGRRKIAKKDTSDSDSDDKPAKKASKKKDESDDDSDAKSSPKKSPKKSPAKSPKKGRKIVKKDDDSDSS
eukprot:TRINITY_DN246_c6_g1_i1.p1 TRINITY_DN246_c6_g1~~TRINITY_DN246_c6_g1_i1.p1  ORF type:complete len:826 (+),score=252.69 TRINITY_DN246_c6_g1_i1:33-2480(+)